MVATVIEGEVVPEVTILSEGLSPAVLHQEVL